MICPILNKTTARLEQPDMKGEFALSFGAPWASRFSAAAILQGTPREDFFQKNKEIDVSPE